MAPVSGCGFPFLGFCGHGLFNRHTTVGWHGCGGDAWFGIQRRRACSLRGGGEGASFLREWEKKE